jgi:FtsZ-binding cell division protein ZapB
MDRAAVTSAIAQLIARVEELQTENADLRAKNQDCAKTVARLVARVENLQSVQAELKMKLHAHPAHSYRKRPPVMRGRTVQTNVGCGPLYITLNEDAEGRPFEVFFKLGKSGSCQQSYLEALGVAMSVGLRYGADPMKFVEKFEGMRCPNPKMRDSNGPTTLSCADGISQGLANALALVFPLANPDARAEADVVAVAEPRFPVSPEEQRENAANAKSIDLIASLPTLDLAGGTAPSNGNGGYASALPTMTELPQPNFRKAMMAGVGMCPKCGGNLISQGGCIQCLQECGYVGKCS